MVVVAKKSSLAGWPAGRLVCSLLLHLLIECNCGKFFWTAKAYFRLLQSSENYSLRNVTQ